MNSMRAAEVRLARRPICPSLFSLVLVGVVCLPTWAQLAKPKATIWMGPPSYENGKCFRELFEHPDEWRETKPKNETYPRSTIVRFQFPAREGMPEVKLTWWDGGMLPPRPEELEEGRQMGDSDGGVLFVGDKGCLVCGCYGRNPQLIPETKMQAYQQPAQTLKRIPNAEGGHEQDWIRACKDGTPSSSNFDYSGPLSEMVLMGNLAVRYPNRKLRWDGEKMEVTNDAEANSYVRRQYRRGWTL